MSDLGLRSESDMEEWESNGWTFSVMLADACMEVVMQHYKYALFAPDEARLKCNVPELTVGYVHRQLQTCLEALVAVEKQVGGRIELGDIALALRANLHSAQSAEFQSVERRESIKAIINGVNALLRRLASELSIPEEVVFKNGDFEEIMTEWIGRGVRGVWNDERTQVVKQLMPWKSEPKAPKASNGV